MLTFYRPQLSAALRRQHADDYPQPWVSSQPRFRSRCGDKSRKQTLSLSLLFAPTEISVARNGTVLFFLSLPVLVLLSYGRVPAEFYLCQSCRGMCSVCLDKSRRDDTDVRCHRCYRIFHSSCLDMYVCMRCVVYLVVQRTAVRSVRHVRPPTLVGARITLRGSDSRVVCDHVCAVCVCMLARFCCEHPPSRLTVFPAFGCCRGVGSMRPTDVAVVVFVVVVVVDVAFAVCIPSNTRVPDPDNFHWMCTECTQSEDLKVETILHCRSHKPMDPAVRLTRVNAFRAKKVGGVTRTKVNHRFFLLLLKHASFMLLYNHSIVQVFLTSRVEKVGEREFELPLVG